MCPAFFMPAYFLSLTFSAVSGIIFTLVLYIEIFRAEVLALEKKSSFTVFLSIVSALAAIAAAIVAATLYFEKKQKDEEELEHYLDCSIQ